MSSRDHSKVLLKLNPCVPNTHQPLQAKRQLHDLVITEQPQPEFYKGTMHEHAKLNFNLKLWTDEGGKGNVLRVEVTAPAEYELIESIPLHLVLHYESGARVEEEDQKILVIMNQPAEGFWLTPDAQVVCFEFRLEKVCATQLTILGFAPTLVAGISTQGRTKVCSSRRCR